MKSTLFKLLILSLYFGFTLTPALAQRPPFNDLLNKADQALKANDIDKAVIFYEKLANFYPQSSDAWNKLGYAQYKKGNDPRAIYAFRKSLSLSRGNQEALHNLVLASGRQADNLTRSSHFSEAAKNLDELIANYSWHPQYAVLLYYRGRLEFFRGHPSLGLPWWSKAASLASTSGVAKIMAAQARPLNDKTIALYQEASSKVKAEPAFDYLLGERFEMAGRYAEAIKSYSAGLEKCKEANLPFPLLQLRLGQAYLATGNPKEAVGLLEEARLRRPDWASVPTLLWAANLAQGLQPKADAYLQDAYELDRKPKLALLGDPNSVVRLTTPGGSIPLAAVTAVSPSPGKATLTIGTQSLAIEINPGDALVYQVSGDTISLASQSSLAHQGDEERSLAPALVLKDRKGRIYRLTSALLKRPIVIAFWSVKKAGASSILNGLGALQSRYSSKIETVAIHTDPADQSKALKAYLSQPGTYAQLWGDEKICQDFGLQSSPAIVVIDLNGRIVLREVAPNSQLFQELPSFIDSLLP